MTHLNLIGRKMNKNIRIISRLDIKNPNLIKGINLEGVRVVGCPEKFATHYYESGIDEILYMDAVATLYNRNSIAELVSFTAKNTFVPIAVGGGIRSLGDVDRMLRSGADKVAINTAIVSNPSIINDITSKFGSQVLVLSIEAKKCAPNKWEIYTDNGREKTGIDVIEWVIQAQERGIGEIIVTSVDKEGMCSGFDIDLMKAIDRIATVPVIASGGMGTIDHAIELIEQCNVDAIAIANILHYQKTTVQDIKEALYKKNINVRL